MSDKREAKRIDTKNNTKDIIEAPPAKKQHLLSAAAVTSPGEEEALKSLAEIQDQLQGIDDECVKEQMQIQKKYDVQKAPLFEERQNITSKIPNFWGRALLNHGALASIVEEDKDFIKCLTCIDLEDNLDDAGSYKIKFVFSDEVKGKIEPLELIKHVVFGESNVASVKFVTPIKFNNDKDPREKAQKQRNEGLDSWSIFEWFSESDSSSNSMVGVMGESPPGDETPDLGEIVRRHFWHTPLSYYLNDVSDDENDDSCEEELEEEEEDE